jgi:hypothetical protein
MTNWEIFEVVTVTIMLIATIYLTKKQDNKKTS